MAGQIGQLVGGDGVGLNVTPVVGDPVTLDCRNLAPIEGTRNRTVLVSTSGDGGDEYTTVELQGSNDNGATWEVVLDYTGQPSSTTAAATFGTTYFLLGADYDFLRLVTTGGGPTANAQALVAT